MARAREKRAARAEIDAAWEDIEEDQRIRECWRFFYSRTPAWMADQILDLYDIPRPPSRR